MYEENVLFSAESECEIGTTSSGDIEEKQT